jgi:hypothetical protein
MIWILFMTIEREVKINSLPSLNPAIDNAKVFTSLEIILNLLLLINIAKPSLLSETSKHFDVGLGAKKPL